MLTSNSPRRLLITGANGFVGRYASAAFAAVGYQVFRAGFETGDHDLELNLRDMHSVKAAVVAARPDAVLHLAAQSFVPAAIADPLATYDVNVLGTARLVQALREEERPVRLLFASSAEVYGRQALRHLPLTETDAVAPGNPYAASKAAAEHIAHVGRNAHVGVVIARPFNHIGPGQNELFVVAGFAAQLAAVMAGAAPLVLVGNLEAERDFLDVRDVVRAYVLLMEHGIDGEWYNIAAGTPFRIAELLRRLIVLADVPVAVREDPARMRPSDIPCFYGDADKIRQLCGWTPLTSIDTSLRDILAAARQLQPAGERAAFFK